MEVEDENALLVQALSQNQSEEIAAQKEEADKTSDIFLDSKELAFYTSMNSDKAADEIRVMETKRAVAILSNLAPENAAKILGSYKMDNYSIKLTSILDEMKFEKLISILNFMRDYDIAKYISRNTMDVNKSIQIFERFDSEKVRKIFNNFDMEIVGGIRLLNAMGTEKAVQLLKSLSLVHASRL